MSRTAIIAASVAAVEPSYMEALATSMPVSSQIMRLKFEDGLQRSLGNLRLIWGIRRQKFAAGDQRVNDNGTIVRISSCPKKSRVAVAVLSRTLAEPIHDLRLSHLAGHSKIAIQPVLGRDGREKIVNRADADGLQHGGPIGGRFRQIAHGNLY